MSSHDGHDHGHDHGHGHGHDHAHGHVEDRNKPIAVAAVIVIGFLFGAYYLVQSGTAARAATHGGTSHATPAEHGQAGDDRAGHDHAGHDHSGAAAPAKAGDDRASFVATFDEGQRRMGFTLHARAAGHGEDTFEIRWDGAPEPGKIEALKNAAQLHVEARGRGFKKIAIVVNGKPVWEKTL